MSVSRPARVSRGKGSFCCYVATWAPFVGPCRRRTPWLTRANHRWRYFDGRCILCVQARLSIQPVCCDRPTKALVGCSLGKSRVGIGGGVRRREAEQWGMAWRASLRPWSCPFAKFRDRWRGRRENARPPRRGRAVRDFASDCLCTVLPVLISLLTLSKQIVERARPKKCFFQNHVTFTFIREASSGAS